MEKDKSGEYARDVCHQGVGVAGQVQGQGRVAVAVEIMPMARNGGAPYTGSGSRCGTQQDMKTPSIPTYCTIIIM